MTDLNICQEIAGLVRLFRFILHFEKSKESLSVHGKDPSTPLCSAQDDTLPVILSVSEESFAVT
jgi:hypothetical protein